MVAYCIAGHTRGFENELSQPSSHFKLMRDVQIFISTWEFLGDGHIFWQGGEESESPINTKALLKNYSPFSLEIEKRSAYSNLFHFDIPFPSNSTVNVLNTLLMFKKIKRSFEMTNEHHQILVRGRFDLTELVMPRMEVESGKVYGKYSSMNGFTSDIFFYGERKTMLESIPDETFYTDEIIATSMNAEHVFQKYLAHKHIQFINEPSLGFVLKNDIRY